MISDAEIKEKIRCDSIVTEQILDNGERIRYRTFFIDKSFHVYRFVKRGIGYRGNNYPEDGYALVYSDNFDVCFLHMPAFVGLGDK